jgi:hypothetical protein
MPTLSESAAFAQDPELAGPLTSAVVATAIQIMNEDPTTPGHRTRVGLASQILNFPAGAVEKFAWALSTNPIVVDKWTAGDKAASQADFAYVISTVYNAIAGLATSVD